MKTYSERINILGTLHLTHGENDNYTYQDVLDAIDAFKPEVIGVEIRPQDMTEANDYLKRYYPPEMVMVKEHYEGTHSVLGFDFRGTAIESKRIEAWLTTGVSLRTLMKTDDQISELVAKRKALMEPFYTRCTLEDCQSQYAYKAKELAGIQEALDKRIVELGHQDILTSRELRDKTINTNIEKILNTYPDQRVMFITGMSHKPVIEAYLSAQGIR